MKINLLMILICCIFIDNSIQACSKGCLKCSITNSKCLVCDFKNNYFINENYECQKVLSSNCLIPQLDSPNCIQCVQNHMIDYETLKCVPIPYPFEIKNCEFYDDHRYCKICKTNFFSMKHSCLPVQKQITNCKYYLTPTKCMKCEESFSLSSDLSSCTSSNSKCLVSSFFKCDDCTDGYFLNSSSFFISNLKNFFQIKWPLLEPSLRFMRNFSCSSINSSSLCLEHDSLGRCKKCKEGYGLHPTKAYCLQISPSIDNCKLYSSLDSCITCQNFYYLENSSKCSRINPIVNCFSYDSSANKSLCTQCDENFYLSSENICSERIESLNIKNCIEKVPNQDKCSKCDSKHQITSDGLKCLDKINNCLEYDVSTKVNRSLACRRCNDYLFYSISLGRCIDGPVLNCKKYFNLSSLCQECSNNYFLHENTCIQHSYISNCQIYSPSMTNKCEVCHSPSLLLNLVNTCVSFPLVLNCKTYNNDECEECMSGYQLINNTCLEIQKPEYCLEASSDLKCSKCQNFFFLKEDNHNINCELSNAFEQKYVSFSDGTSSEFDIIGCEEFAYVDFNEKFQTKCFHINNSDSFDFTVESSVFESNCQFYFEIDSSIKCLQCNENFFLLEHRCVSNCGIYPSMMIETSFNSGFTITVKNICDTSSTNNPNLLLNDVFIQTTDITFKQTKANCKNTSRNYGMSHISDTLCSRCVEDENIIPYINISSISFATATIHNEKNNNFHSLYRNVLGIQCLNIFENKYKNIFIIPNCELYILENEIYKCMKCEIGFSPITSKISLDSEDISLITDCNKMTTCNMFSSYDGKGLSIDLLSSLNLPLESSLSCFECNSGELFYFGKIDNHIIMSSIFSLDVNSNELLDSASGNISNISCFSLLELSNYFSSFGQVDNCAIYFVDVSQTLKNSSVDATSLSSSVSCLACKNGFSAKYNQNTKLNIHVVTECEAIENCELSSESKTFNFCSECSPSFLHIADVNKINYKVCSKYNNIDIDPNCLNMNGTSQKCIMCKEGFSINIEGVCDVVSKPFCQESGFIFGEVQYSNLVPIRSDESNLFDFSFLDFVMKDSSRGCKTCEDGFLPILSDLIPKQCFKSKNMKNNLLTQISTNSVFILNCESHSFSNGIINCFKCTQNYLPTSDKSKCIKMTDSTTLCAELDISNELNCTTCLSGKIKSGSKCFESDIENCEIVIPENSTSSLKCQKCNDGYYFNTTSNSCQKGNFFNCRIYPNDDPNTCIQCVKSHILENIDGNLQCLYIPFSNCYGITRDSENFLSCNECSYLNVLSDFKTASSENSIFYKDSVSVCISKDQIPHCVEYSSDNSFDFSSPKCKKCLDDHFLDLEQNECVFRENNILGCIEYSLTSEICTNCDKEFILEDGFCIYFPDVAQNCMIYQNLNDCQLCKTGFYLEKGKCYQSDPINNCSEYLSKTLCKSCNKGTYLSIDKSECKSISIPNCVALDSNSVCVECDQNSILIEFDETVTCESIPDPNCQKFDNSKKCLECKNGHFLDSSGNCFSISSLIENCSYQTSDTKCNTCKRGYYLNINETECVLIESQLWYFIDPACSDVKMTSELNCLVCERGYKDETKGECSNCSHLAQLYTESEERLKLAVRLNINLNEISQVETYFEQTCQICSLDTCLLCKSDYYMDSEGYCIGNLSLQDNVTILQDESIDFVNPYDYIIELEFKKILQLFSCGIMILTLAI